MVELIKEEISEEIGCYIYHYQSEHYKIKAALMVIDDQVTVYVDVEPKKWNLKEGSLPLLSGMGCCKNIVAGDERPVQYELKMPDLPVFFNEKLVEYYKEAPDRMEEFQEIIDTINKLFPFGKTNYPKG